MEKQYKQRVSQQHRLPASAVPGELSHRPPACRPPYSAGETKSYKINRLGLNKLK